VTVVHARLASQNRHKLTELRRALPDWELDLLDAGALPPENGSSYLENARAKARFAREHSPRSEWALGEDSGVEVEALAGRPGISSARWADDGVSRLLSELAGEEQREARYVCVLSAISPTGRELHATGILPGTIGPERRGSEGFGYDPIFVPAGESRTVAELGDTWKSLHSHRARAAAALDELVRADRSLALRRSRRVVAAERDLPVEHGAEDDHVREQEQPDDEECARPQDLEGDEIPREAVEER
jgi:XTP/dITP diphosphohydrolase